MTAVKQQTQQQKFERLTNAPIPGLIVSLSIPTVISMLISSFYNMADTFFVGRIGTSATGAVGVIFPLMSIIQALGFFFGHGSGNYISRCLGAQDTENARKMATTGFIFALIAGALFGVAGLIFIDPLVRLLGATPTIAPYARDYASVILYAAPFMTASLVLNNQLRFQGSAFYGMIGMATGAVLNIGLDPLFIFTFNMGVKGAALATAISQVVSFVLLLIGCSRGGNIPIRLKDFSPSFARFGEIIRGGIPSLFRQGLASVATICLNTAAGLYGDAAIAGMSIVTRILFFANAAVIGLGQGFQPVCGFNYGAKKYARVRKAFWFCVMVAFCILLAWSAVCEIFAPTIIGFFRDDPLVIEVGARALRYQCMILPLAAWIVLCNMMTQTMGMAFRATLLATARNALFFIPAVLLLPIWFGLTGVEISQTVADALSMLLSVPIGIGVLNELKRKEAALALEATEQEQLLKEE